MERPAPLVARFDDAEVWTLREIAHAYNMDERYAAFVLGLAFPLPNSDSPHSRGRATQRHDAPSFARTIDAPVSWQAQHSIF